MASLIVALRPVAEGRGGQLGPWPMHNVDFFFNTYIYITNMSLVTMLAPLKVQWIDLRSK